MNASVRALQTGFKKLQMKGHAAASYACAAQSSSYEVSDGTPHKRDKMIDTADGVDDAGSCTVHSASGKIGDICIGLV